MRGSTRVFLAGLALAFCAAAGTAFAVEKEPVSGGLLSIPGQEVSAPKTATAQASSATMAAEPREVPAPLLAPAPALAQVAAEPVNEHEPAWGLLVRGGYFGLPNFIANELFFKHPDIVGSTFGAEIRYNGREGRRGGSSIGLAVDTASAETDGEWQQHESDAPVSGSGEVSMLAITLTKYWTLFPSWYVHPYVGLGIGAAHVKGFYLDETERVDADIWIPSIHIPVGLAFELGRRLQVGIEGRFIDGIAIGGTLQARF